VVNSCTGAPYLSNSPVSAAIQIGVWLGLVPTMAMVTAPGLGAGSGDSLAAGLAEVAAAPEGAGLAGADAAADAAGLALAAGLVEVAGLAAALAGALEAGAVVPPQALNRRQTSKAFVIPSAARNPRPWTDASFGSA